MKHFKWIESDPNCESFEPLASLAAADNPSDARLGQSINIAPPIEEAYEFLENWPEPFGKE